MRRDPLPYLLIPVAALIATLPLILHGPSCGHDFTFHILNWFEAAAQFRHGNLHPQWAVSPAWNAGEPRFVFYPPLSWTLGAILGLLLPWAATPIAYTWLTLTASGLAMHRLARAHAAPTAALLASTLYLANPYMLFTAYERTAYAELLAAAFLPLLVHAILKPRPTIPAIALPLALLWLTNAPAAVMATYTLALLAIIRLVTSTNLSSSINLSSSTNLSSFRVAGGPAFRRVPHTESRVPHLRRLHRLRWVPRNLHETASIALTTTAGTLLGLSLAAFYLIPAALNRPLVQIAMVVLPGMRIDDNTLFHHTGQTEDALAHDAVLHTASLLAILILTLTLAALLLAKYLCHSEYSKEPPHSRRSATKLPSPTSNPSTPTSNKLCHPSATREDLLFAPAPPILPLAILTLTLAVLLTPLSLPIWRHAPELAFLQFPWRLLAILATVLSLATALASSRLIWKPLTAACAALTLAATLTYTATPLFRQPCDPEDTVPTRLTAFQTHQGAEPTDEYTPTEADNDSLHPRNPPFWLSPDPDAPPPADATPGPAPRDLTLTSPTPQTLILNLRQYPAWHITLNGHDLPAAPQTPRADGLINLPIPPGTDRIHLTYRATPLDHAAEALSLLALILLLYLATRRNQLN